MNGIWIKIKGKMLSTILQNTFQSHCFENVEQDSKNLTLDF